MAFVLAGLCEELQKYVSVALAVRSRNRVRSGAFDGPDTDTDMDMDENEISPRRRARRPDGVPHLRRDGGTLIRRYQDVHCCEIKLEL
ncbi:hypothetical protein LTR70_009042 [Exophiala xenobiotica]|uniref:Uncharacterized protein n=1 Tax=Lithohypha guttulata TaxID=1690604 RepID=A0ABR0JZ53_9EURO|nr:hypothetical protein LTR24_008739 [Lithohypha guttulata]KAK5311092.1 hypothetical protein LTR70_009042 [Exophiala xenobiotica]